MRHVFVCCGLTVAYLPEPIALPAVVAVDGNRVTIHDGEKKNVQDKNKLKYVPTRPRYLEHNHSKSIHRSSAKEEADTAWKLDS